MKGKTVEQHLQVWLEKHSTEELIAQAEALPLRRDMVTLLTFARDTRVVGTTTRGNMPLKALQAVTAQFVVPPVLEYSIGQQLYRVRTEMDVWPLYYLHILADVGMLLKTPPARRWEITPKGKSFLEAHPLFQTAFMLTTWWHRVNWLVAFPYVGMGDSLPQSFGLATLVSLQRLPVGTPVPFEEFADTLIEKTGLTWRAEKLEMRHSLLQSSIARMVINILEDFAALKPERRKETVGKSTSSKLVAFEITPFGKAMLDAAAI